MAAHATHHLIDLVNGIGIATIAPATHTTRDHPVGKGSEIDTKKLRPSLNAGCTTVAIKRTRGILVIQHGQETRTEFWGSRQAQEIALTEWGAEAKLWVVYYIFAVLIVGSNIGSGNIELSIVSQARETKLTLQAPNDKLQHLCAIRT
ncbi:hypothetical protein [Tolypothrix sp. NIES-4075]|uniref:hypothetical protein n=1 Tax=Tolypothrix sp. NIES-4075 TaxID=2005459 RepID=UPI001F389346|nr:hypothetical protein [Tolypothrix sp. NIES-4075]